MARRDARGARRRARRGWRPRSPAGSTGPRSSPAGLRTAPAPPRRRRSARSASSTVRPGARSRRGRRSRLRRRGLGERLLVAVAHRRHHDRVGVRRELARDPPADRRRQRSASVRAAGPSPTTASSGAGSCGSTSTSTDSLGRAGALGDDHVVRRVARVPGGPIRTSRGSPSARARTASRTTSGSEHAPPIQPWSAPSPVTRARSPRRVEAGGATATTVASANGLPSPASSAASHQDVGPGHSARPTSCSACQTLSEVTGISRLRTPTCARASTTAFTNAAGEPTVADSPTPFAPIGWCGDGVTVS